ncbi:hypothetical protein K435DRAFT_878839 [Dendrothele bispora CBS 962.96]|uniref:Uncharacterized protein n=1 Tax=Dendrothele bispora (strain CBS 962.96) TaxID=1314807 RepID=A0A4S8KM69_DENBC|nr:hypothetical protein K435DRAFT_878839 [Dendrothele bispora CBS 962.96]
MSSRAHMFMVTRSPEYIRVLLYEVPPLLYFNIYDGRMNASQKMFLEQPNREIVRFTLRAVAYFGGYHFTCRFIDATGSMYYHDGLTCGTHVHNEQLNANTVNDQVFKTADNGRKIMIGALYIKD